MTEKIHVTEALLSSVLLQLIVMIAAARLLNRVAVRLRQPGVVGEIIAGLLGLAFGLVSATALAPGIDPVAYSLFRAGVIAIGLATMEDALWLALVLALAIAGKILPVYATSRACGFSRPESAVLGSLMNTRALMELIVLNIGYDLGVLPQKVFTMPLDTSSEVA